MSQYGGNQVDLSIADSPWTLIYNMIDPESKVLDIGCSSGYFASTLQQKNCVVDGIEVDSKDAKLAEKFCRRVVVADVETLDLKKTFKDKYDTILFIDVLEHFKNPASVLKQAKSLLKPSGNILFSIPNMAHISVRLQLLAGNFDYTPDGILDRTHLHFYTKNAITGLFESAGLQVQQIEPSFVFPVPDKLLDKYLDAAGLKATQKTKAIMSGVEATAYQFVGKAGLHKSTQNSKPRKAQPTWQDSKDDLIHELDGHLKSYREKLTARDHEVEELKQQINHYQSSTSARIKRKFSKVSKKIKSIGR